MGSCPYVSGCSTVEVIEPIGLEPSSEESDLVVANKDGVGIVSVSIPVTKFGLVVGTDAETIGSLCAKAVGAHIKHRLNSSLIVMCEVVATPALVSLVFTSVIKPLETFLV